MIGSLVLKIVLALNNTYCILSIYDSLGLIVLQRDAHLSAGSAIDKSLLHNVTKHPFTISTCKSFPTIGRQTVAAHSLNRAKLRSIHTTTYVQQLHRARSKYPHRMLSCILRTKGKLHRFTPPRLGGHERNAMARCHFNCDRRTMV